MRVACADWESKAAPDVDFELLNTEFLIQMEMKLNNAETGLDVFIAL